MMFLSLTTFKGKQKSDVGTNIVCGDVSAILVESTHSLHNLLTVDNCTLVVVVVHAWCLFLYFQVQQASKET